MTGNNDKADSIVEFSGLTRHNDDWVPDEVWGHGSSMRWWASERSGDEDDPELPGRSFNEAIDTLPRATTAEVGWKHPITGEWIPTEKHNAVIEPQRAEQVFTESREEKATGAVEQFKNGEMDIERLEERIGEIMSGGEAPATRADLEAEAGAEGFQFFDPDEYNAGDEALWYVPTDDYTVINPSQFLRPLAEVARDEELGDSMFGDFRLYRDGGRVSADVFFDGKHVEHPDMDDDRKPIVVGMQIDWDFFGGTSVRAQGMGMDWECINALRSITDRITIKHAGDVEERVDWHAEWESLLEQIDLKVDQLAQMIQRATEERLDVSDLPDDFAQDYDSVLEALYAYSGLPDYLAEVAANNLRAEADDPFEPNFWQMHRGATYAISHRANGEIGAGGSIEDYNRVANDMLMNPPLAEETIQQGYVQQVAEADETTLEEEGGGEATVWLDEESIREKKERFEERQDEIAQLVEAGD